MSRTIERECANCGKVFPVSVTNKHRILCGSETCKTEWHRKLVRERQELDKRKCIVCGSYFFPLTRRSKCCGEDCRHTLTLRKNAERYYENKERYLETNKKYRVKNREKLSKQSVERVRLWRQRNPQKYQAQNNESRFDGLWTISMQGSGYTCKQCGAKKGLVVHHIDGNPTNNVLLNLVVLCKSCHAKVHEAHKNLRNN